MKKDMIGLCVGVMVMFSFGLCWPYTVLVEWAPNSESDLAGYVVYYGTDTRIYSTSADIGRNTSHQISGLVEGVTYYFAVTAYNASGAESVYSEEVSFLEPGSGGGGSGGGNGGTEGGSGTSSSGGGGGGGGGCFIRVLDEGIPPFNR